MDILVNNAGITRDNLLARMTTEQWDEVISINLTAVYQMMRWITPHMLRRRQGRVMYLKTWKGEALSIHAAS